MTTVPLFPLNAVIFPGSVTPLHIFEERYRTLVRDLLGKTDQTQRVFGIVAIREGYEVGRHGISSVHRVGTLVRLSEVQEQPEGTFDIEVTALSRLRVRSHDPTGAYLRGEVEVLADNDEPGAQEEARRTRAAFEGYRVELSKMRGGPVLVGEMPSDPAYLSYALAGICLLTLPQRQALLEAEDAQIRLGMLRRALIEELRAMRALPSLPATEVARTRWSPN